MADPHHHDNRPHHAERVFQGTTKFGNYRMENGNVSLTLTRRQLEGIDVGPDAPLGDEAPAPKGLHSRMWLPESMVLRFNMQEGNVVGVSVISGNGKKKEQAKNDPEFEMDDGSGEEQNDDSGDDDVNNEMHHVPPFHLVISTYPVLDDPTTGAVTVPQGSILNWTSNHPMAKHHVGPHPMEVVKHIVGLDTVFHVRLTAFARRWVVYQDAVRAKNFKLDQLQMVVPRNATMGMNFAVFPVATAEGQVATIGSLGVWVRRRPPIPDYFLEVFAKKGKLQAKKDGDAEDAPLARVLRLSFADVHPEGMGVDNVLAALHCDAKSRDSDGDEAEGNSEDEKVMEDTGDEKKPKMHPDDIHGPKAHAACSWIRSMDTLWVFRVTFEEVPREYHAIFQVKNYENVLAGLLTYDGATKTLQAARAKYPVDHPPEGSRPAKLGLVFKRELQIELQYIAELHSVALMVVQSRPIRRLQVHVVDGEGSTVILEEESYVPYMGKSSSQSRGNANTMLKQHKLTPGAAGSKKDAHFGWYKALPSNRTLAGNSISIRVYYDTRDEASSEATRQATTLDGVNKGNTGSVIMPPEGEDSTLNHLKRWLLDHGAHGIEALQMRRNKAGLMRLFFNPTKRAKAGPGGASLLQPGETIAALPYMTLLADPVASSVKFVADIMRHTKWMQMRQALRVSAEEDPQSLTSDVTDADAFTQLKKRLVRAVNGVPDSDSDNLEESLDQVTERVEAEKKFASQYHSTPSRDGHEDQVVRLTLFLLTQPESQRPDGTRFHLYLSSIIDLVHHVREKEKVLHDGALMANHTLIKAVAHYLSSKLYRETLLHEARVEAEYKAAITIHPWLEHRVDLELYSAVRSHIATRVHNSSDGTLFLTPLLDHLVHSDQPCAKFTADNQRGHLKIVAAHKIDTTNAAPSESVSDDESDWVPLTVDFGASSMTKTSFLSRYGTVPLGAVDSVDIGSCELLYHDKSSRQPLLDQIRAELVAEQQQQSDGGKVVSEAHVLDRYQEILVTRLQSIPHKHPETVILNQQEIDDATHDKLLQAQGDGVSTTREGKAHHLTEIDEDDFDEDFDYPAASSHNVREEEPPIIVPDPIEVSVPHHLRVASDRVLHGMRKAVERHLDWLVDDRTLL